MKVPAVQRSGQGWIIIVTCLHILSASCTLLRFTCVQTGECVIDR